MMKFKITFLTIVSTLILVSCATEPKEAPVVDFLTKNIVGSNVTVTGEVISTAGDDMTLRGFCWSTSPSPTKDDAVIIDTLKGLGTYTLSLPNLLGETEYYLRAFAENSFGVAYSGNISFKTAYGMNSRGCIVCSGSNPTDVISVNGQNYTVVDSSALYNLVNIDADLSKICISKITNLSDLNMQPKGDIGNWDVSNVTNMNGLFKRPSTNTFNADIGNWDVSNVESMVSMFWNATEFNQDISEWDVGNVTDMHSMFAEASSFNQDLNNWDVSNVNDMQNMFIGASSFNGKIDDWDVGNVKSMYGMFSSASSFNRDIGDWDVSSVEDMFFMFYEAISFNQDIGAWNVGAVLTMDSMFERASLFNENIGNWDVSNVQSMLGMFWDATEFNQDLSQWCVSNISTLPPAFATNSSLTPSNYPVWGTCP